MPACSVGQLEFHEDATTTFFSEYMGTITNGDNENSTAMDSEWLAVKVQSIVDGLPGELHVAKAEGVLFHAEPINRVLIREVEHNNRTLNVIRQSLEWLLSSGVDVEWSTAAAGLKTLARDITRDVIPRLWMRAFAFPSDASLTEFLQMIKRQVNFIKYWSSSDSPVTYEFAYLTFHKSLIVACKMSYARRHRVDIHDVELKTRAVVPVSLVGTCDFIVVSDLYVSGAEWLNNRLTMSKNCSVSFHKMPNVVFEMVDRGRTVCERTSRFYECPLYVSALKEQLFLEKVDNFICSLELDTDEDPRVLSVCGAALFCKIE